MLSQYYELVDAEHDAVKVKIKYTRWFGVLAYGTIHDTFHILPMIQRVPKSGDDLSRSGQYYYIHALPEQSVDRVINGYKLLALVRGIPSTSQCPPVEATCLLGIRERVLSVLKR